VPDVNNATQIKLFWDIDGTLLNTNGAAAIPFARAVSDFAGKNLVIDRKQLSGFTDFEIARYLLSQVNINPTVQEISKILENYADQLPSYLKIGKVETINNIEFTLNKLFNHPGFELAIGTGNFLEGAQIKLNHVGLLKYFKHENFFCATELFWSRDAIIEQAKISLKQNQIGVVIGDSPRDVLSAHKSDLISIAVPSGGHTALELAEFKPHIILEKSWSYEDLLLCFEELN
jgi:hypothetical protein